MSELPAKTYILSKLKAELLSIWSEGDAAEILIEDAFTSRLRCAWLAGKKLNEIKREAGHGHWLVWLEANAPHISHSKANRCMNLDRDNPGAKGVEDLSKDSVRAFRLGYVPKKERPELPESDRQTLPAPCVHHLAVTNHFTQWHTQVTSGLITYDVEEVRRDWRGIYDFLRTIYNE